MKFKIFGYTFSITETYRKKRGFSSKRWTTSEKNHLLRRHGEKIAITTIAKEMNRTIPSIHSMLQKLHKGK